MDETENLCLGCMKSKGSAVVCPHCGFRMEPDRNPQLLPYATVLNSRFLVGRVLGKPGGFGITYIAWDLSLHTSVAIKEFFPSGIAVRSRGDNTVRIEGSLEQRDYLGGIEVFLQEARTLARFSHPNIARVRDFFEENNTAYMVMDYYEGVSLAEYLHRHGDKLSEAAVLNLVRPVMAGLKEIHQQGFLHRDIKPSNIQITRDGTAVLLDFGSARQFMGEKTTTLSVILTPGYSPLEQYYEKGEQGPWTDVYSVAATLYYLVTGVAPQSAIERLNEDTLAAPIKLNPSLSPRFNLAIMKAMSIKPANRPQEIEGLFQLLDGESTVAFDREPVAAPPMAAAVNYRRGSAAKPGGVSSIKLVHVLGVVLLLIAALIVFNLWEGPVEREPLSASVPVPERKQPPAEAKPLKVQPKTVVEPAQPEQVIQWEPRSDVVSDEADSASFSAPQTAPAPTPPPPRESNSLSLPPAAPDGRRMTEPPPPPQFAIDLCAGLRQGSSCTIKSPHGDLSGKCKSVAGSFACIPDFSRTGGPPPGGPPPPPGGLSNWRR